MNGRILALLVVVLLSPAAARAEPPSEQELAARIDAHLAAAWRQAGIEPAPPADDAEFLRRAWLDLCGVIPPINDPDGISGIRNFLESSDPDKRARLIERLLARPTHSSHFATIWKGILLPADANVQQFGGDAGFQNWLRGRFADNVPYDKMAAELLLASGPPNQNGPTVFFLALQLKPEELAASTSRVFLGTQIQCAQCHDHPFDHWKKRDFWGYAAFFARLLQPSSDPRPVVMQVLDAEQGDVTLPGTGEVVAPTFLGGEASADEEGQDRRKRLVAWLTSRDNPFFARAAVNRVWAILFGRGLVHPVDDFGKHNPASHPELLDELGDHFVETGYDVNRLVRVLARTRAYQLSSQTVGRRSAAATEGHATDSRPAEDRPELFARMAIKSLTAEQLYDCLIEAMRRREEFAPGMGQFAGNRAFDQGRQSFLARFRAPGQAATEYEGGVPLALTLMNGATIRQATDLAQSDLLAALDAPFFTNEERVEVLFLSTISRLPDDVERARFAAHVEKLGAANQRRALGDILWALLNSAEFAFNH